MAPTAPRFRRNTREPQVGRVIRNHFHKEVDSYSAFTEADGKAIPGLPPICRRQKRSACSCVAGLATDLCAAWTALDARKARSQAY
jgi:nicotinamidase/pyrazinamidase